MRDLIDVLLTLEPRARLIGILFASVAVAILDVISMAIIFPIFFLISHDKSEPAPAPINWVVGERPGTEQLYMLGLALVMFVVLKNIAAIMVYFAQNRAACAGISRLSARLVDGYMAAPLEFHLQRKNAQYIRGMRDLPIALYFRGALSCCNLIAEIAGVIVIALALAALEPIGVLSALSFLGILLLINHRLGSRHLHAWGLRSAQLMRRSHGLAVQIFPNMKIVKAAGGEPVFGAQLTEPLREMARIEGNRRTAMNSIRPISEIAMMLSAVIILTAVLYPLEHAIEALPFVAVFAYGALRLLPSVNRISMFANEIKSAHPLIEELRSELEDLGPYLDKAADKAHIADHAFSSTLELCGVSYRYPAGPLPALSGIDVTIRFGEVIGLVGASGAGKSTFVDLLLGLLEPTDGQILVDGRSPRRGAGAQRSAGYVPQSSPLINGTVRENIAFGVPPEEVDDALLRKAAAEARIEEVISELPEGFDTEVGEFGARLSGGQRQRIGIARALYSRPSLLILDEATSDLDTRTEFEITESINALRGQTTIVLVAHRLHLLRSCDRIIFLKDGRITSVGSYEDLLATCADFQDLESVVERYTTAQPESA